MTKATDNLKKVFNQDGVRLCIDNVLYLDGFLFVRGWALKGRKPAGNLTVSAKASEEVKDAANKEIALEVRTGQLRETVAQVFKLDDAGRFSGFEACVEGIDCECMSLEIEIAGDMSDDQVIFEIGEIDQVRSDGRDASNGVLILTEGAPGGPCRRYRGDHLAEELTKQGVRAEVVNINRGFTAEQLNYKHLVLQRVWFPFYSGIIELFKEKGGLVFFEVDDAIFSYDLCMDNDYWNKMPDTQKMEAGQMADTITSCDGVITSTGHLASILKEEFPENPVYVNQNVASDEMISLSEDARNSAEKKNEKSDDEASPDRIGLFRRIGRALVRAVNAAQTGRGTQVHRDRRTQVNNRNSVTIGYFSGTNTHNKDLGMLADVLAAVLKKHKNTRLLLAGQIDVPEALIGWEDRIDRFDPVDWKELPKLIVRADINIVPLEDTEYHRCKSAIKWLEAALVAVPTIATRNEEFSRVVEDEKTGLLCKDTKEWISAFDRLIKDADFRRQIGDAAYQAAIRTFTTDSMNSDLLNLLR